MAQPLSVGSDPRVIDELEKDQYHNEKAEDFTPTHAHPDRFTGVIRPQERMLHDPHVTFEEYYYYAQQTRIEEDNHPRTGTESSIWSIIWPSKSDSGVTQVVENDGKRNLSTADARAAISDEEWTNASRALRTATRGAIFYLITTDILGPFGLPYAFATMGWGPGIALYTVFAVMAGYSGYLLWECYMGLDSYQFPIRSFGDLGYRLYGPVVRHTFNILQGIQLLLNVGLIVISNGEALSQAAKFNLCFIICCLVWAIIGFIVGQIRTLQKFGWLANFAVWINLICMFITMGGAAHSPPNFAGASSAAGAAIGDGSLVAQLPDGSYPPVQTSGGLPLSGSGFAGAVNGAMQAVFAYGGSMVFPEFLAEMRRPKDFLTAMWAAQAFIYFWYMFYGLFLYGYQGQYVVNPSYLGISTYSIQTAGNVFAMISAVIAAALYGNIGIKVIYNNVLHEIFRFPPLTARGGKIAFAVLIPVYWGIAFALAAGIPNFSGLTGVVAAFCILEFTYVFPPMLSIGFYMKKHALLSGEGFDPATGVVTQQDSGMKRMMRGFWARKWYVNAFNVVYFLASLALAGLGAYASIVTLRNAFKENRTTSYTCHSPLDG